MSHDDKHDDRDEYFDGLDDYLADALDDDICYRCGGDGSIEYDDAGPEVWGEDCPSEVNHLVECHKCGGRGRFSKENQS